MERRLMASEKRHGHGRWSRPQIVAIIAGYRRKGWPADEIARKLGTGLAFTEDLVKYLDSTDGQAGRRSASGSAGTAGESSER
jgi:hypothetical protein